MKIDGKQIANKIFEELKTKAFELKKENIVPHLAIILVGDDPASVAYVNQKKLKAEEIGVKTTIIHLPSTVSKTKLIEAIQQFNNDSNVHGIIVQQPLPSQINVDSVVQAIDPAKDVDGFHPDSCFQMPIAMAVMKILEEIGITKTDLKSKKIVVVGKGKTGGKPIIQMLEKEGLHPTVVDSQTQHPEKLTKEADILISAVGKPNIIKPQMIKYGAVLIGVGISRGKSANLMGDYDWKSIENIASFYTPTPGGVGPVDVAMLLKNLVSGAENFVS